jgi:hypothetical protein
MDGGKASIPPVSVPNTQGVTFRRIEATDVGPYSPAVLSIIIGRSPFTLGLCTYSANSSPNFQSRSCAHLSRCFSNSAHPLVPSSRLFLLSKFLQNLHGKAYVYKKAPTKRKRASKEKVNLTSTSARGA